MTTSVFERVCPLIINSGTVRETRNQLHGAVPPWFDFCPSAYRTFRIVIDKWRKMLRAAGYSIRPLIYHYRTMQWATRSLATESQEIAVRTMTLAAEKTRFADALSGKHRSIPAKSVEKPFTFICCGHNDLDREFLNIITQFVQQLHLSQRLNIWSEKGSLPLSQTLGRILLIPCQSFFV